MAHPDPKSLTPAMRQYVALKEQHPEALLLFRMGDFYEIFFDDAKTVSRALGLVLTSRSKGDNAIPMAGFPAHSLEMYVSRLVQAGYRIAICDQLEDPAQAKGLVERGITRIITPGTLTEDTLLAEVRNNYLLAIAPAKKTVGLAWIDVSTGRLVLDEIPPARLADALARIEPAECLLPERACREGNPLREAIDGAFDGALSPRPDWAFARDNAIRTLNEFYGTATLAGFGIDDDAPAVAAAGALIDYLRETQKTALPHVRPPEPNRSGQLMELDRATIASLELTETMRGGQRAGSLLGVLDCTVTGMGARRLRHWLLWPLKTLGEIEQRQEAVAELAERDTLRRALRDALDEVYDVERLASRLACERADARDAVSLGRSLGAMPGLKAVLEQARCDALSGIAQAFDPMPDIRQTIEERLRPDPPATLKEGGIVRDGFSDELDRLRSIRRDGRKWLTRFQQREAERLGIPTLKVGYNRVFGYYIEVRSGQADKAPPEYTRKQTLKNAERYITEELKAHENEAMGAEERAQALEYQLFVELRGELIVHLKRFQALADHLATLDALAALAQTAVENNYVRPAVDDSAAIDIVEGRHPVLERTLPEGEFVPNDCQLDGARRMLAVITGPNMAGKSTYIRQVALTALMAQIGSFVPAKRARIGLVDAIFTRVGASDELARGRSTFMVEMTETACILNAATSRSLVIFDEVGRGTGTFDGMSIAWAVCEHIVQTLRCRALFATHYHQLTGLADLYDGVVNRNVAVREWEDKIVFLHKIVDGGTDKSYGIHVARLAGVPRPVVERARRIMADLEEEASALERKLAASGSRAAEHQLMLNLFGAQAAKAAVEIDSLDIASLTPDEALALLKRLKEDGAT